MADQFPDKLSEVFTQSYTLFHRVEQTMLTKSKRMNLTISELHLIEAINKNPLSGKMVGELASELMITPPSVTSAVNKLEKKGYVLRKKSIDDGRQVYVVLTDQGKRADRIHKRFHKSMAKSISNGMNTQEKNILLGCIDRMNTFLRVRIQKSENNQRQALKKSA